MKLLEVKKALTNLNEVSFKLPNGQFISSHFHVTEVGTVNKKFIDCGGTVRSENVVNFQLWEANDFEHRLAPQKLSSIIGLSEKVLGIEDFLEVEVEYQGETIGKYGLEFNGKHFILTTKLTNCLAPDKCGIPAEKQRVTLSGLAKESNECLPGSGCC